MFANVFAQTIVRHGNNVHQLQVVEHSANFGFWQTIVIIIVCIPVAAIVGYVFLKMLEIFLNRPKKDAKGSRSKKMSPENNVDETLIIQEIHHGLTQMEKRIEALETIVLDRAREDK